MAGYGAGWRWMTVRDLRELLQTLPDDALIGPNPNLSGMTAFLALPVAKDDEGVECNWIGYLDWLAEDVKPFSEPQPVTMWRTARPWP